MKKILFVEDNKIAKKVGLLLLNEFDYRVDTAETAKDALLLVKQHRYSLIFMDVGLPDADGTEVIKTIRKIDIHNQNVPIIVLSACSDEATRQKALINGANQFFSKPINFFLTQKILQHYM